MPDPGHWPAPGRLSRGGSAPRTEIPPGRTNGPHRGQRRFRQISHPAPGDDGGHQFPYNDDPDATDPRTLRETG